MVKNGVKTLETIMGQERFDYLANRVQILTNTVASGIGFGSGGLL